jgi:hypothetical protein
MQKKQPSSWRFIALGIVALAGLATIVGTGGGNGGIISANGGGTNILPTYGFSIGALIDGTTQLTAAIETDTATYGISIDLGQSLTGTVDTSVDNAGNIILTSAVIDSGSHMSLATSDGLSLLGTFDVTVVTDLESSLHGPPAAGVVEATSGTEVVRAEIVPDGVELSLNGGTPVAFTWDQINALWLDDTAPDWQRRGALALSALDLVFSRALMTNDALNLIDDTLPANNPRQESCDAFTSGPPAGISAQGIRTLTWLGSGSLQPGDDFRWSFIDCWINNPDNNVDDVFNGDINLRGYVNVDSGGNLTRTGFEPFGFGTSEGGVLFDNLEITRIVEDSLGNFTVDPNGRTTLNGGFVVVFFAP